MVSSRQQRLEDVGVDFAGQSKSGGSLPEPGSGSFDRVVVVADGRRRWIVGLECSGLFGDAFEIFDICARHAADVAGRGPDGGDDHHAHEPRTVLVRRWVCVRER